MFNENEMRPIPAITEERDKPPADIKNAEEKMPVQEVKDYEKRIQALKDFQNIRIKEKAYSLILACIIVLLLLYGIDTLLINLELKNSQLLNGVFELIKFLLSSLFGFVFAQKMISN
jgi:hypothetical protein